jgi:organic hydroperoxide reductase OsmC/OhrA
VHSFPHLYRVRAQAGPDAEVVLSAEGLEPIRSLPPVEFDGPGDRWSPETLLCAALADCLLMTFRVIAKASRIPWEALEISLEGRLEREQGNSHFTHFRIEAVLRVPAGVDPALAERALHKAEAGCLISNSLKATRELVAQVVPA